MSGADPSDIDLDRRDGAAGGGAAHGDGGA